MADLKGKLVDIVQGDDFDIVRTIDNIGEGQSLAEGWFIVKEEYWSETAIFSIYITIIQTQNGVISDSGSTDGEGEVLFRLSGVYTALLEEFYDYVYEIKVKTNEGTVYTPESGIIRAFARIGDGDSIPPSSLPEWEESEW